MTNPTARDTIAAFHFGPDDLGVEWTDHLIAHLERAGFEIVPKGAVAKERGACIRIAKRVGNNSLGVPGAIAADRIAAAICARGKE